MKKVFVFIFLFVFNALPLLSQEYETMLDSAKHYYGKGNYERSIEIYEQILEQGKESAEIYYNLGNAYYSIYQVAPAILNYERAKLRAPNDEDIQYNLNLAREQVTDKIEQIPPFFLVRWYNNFVDSLSSDGWAVLSMITFLAFLVFFSVFLYTKRYRLKKSSFGIALLALLLSVATFMFSYQQKQEVLNSNQAIVFSKKVTVRSSPSTSGTELFVLHEGTKVFIEDEMGDWYEVRLSDGNKGWMKEEHLEII
ncbi:MAG: tetratricopeptide repeat protein [Bacteroidales bacterium]